MHTIFIGANIKEMNLGSWGTGCFVNMTYTAPTAPTRTELNFICGTDIVIHCNPRYDERVGLG